MRSQHHLLPWQPHRPAVGLPPRASWVSVLTSDLYCCTWINKTLCMCSGTGVWSCGWDSKDSSWSQEGGGSHRWNEVSLKHDDISMKSVLTMISREANLPPYVPEMKMTPLIFVNYNQTVGGLRSIYSTPSGLESTSLVLACGLGTSVSPSPCQSPFTLLSLSLLQICTSLGSCHPSSLTC